VAHGIACAHSSDLSGGSIGDLGFVSNRDAGRRWVGLLINTVVGVLLLFGTNLVVSPPIPINIITLLICAIGGVAGWLIIMVLYLLQIAFYVPA
jgi:hypothetical protein